jgi:hypothetical protein
MSRVQKITSYEAHPDYIRAIAVHPTLPYLLTASVRECSSPDNGMGANQLPG